MMGGRVRGVDTEKTAKLQLTLDLYFDAQREKARSPAVPDESLRAGSARAPDGDRCSRRGAGSAMSPGPQPVWPKS